MISYPPHSSSSSSPSPSPSTSPRQLQGPRPTPLKVRKDSYKINKKAPALPQNPNPVPLANNINHQQPPPPPVIIYTVSPKIIHTKPSDFMTLVQRLTGPDSVDSPSARFAAVQTAAKFSSSPTAQQQQQQVIHDDDSGDHGSSVLMVERSGATGILSPVPSSLQPISPSFFSPISSSFDADAGLFGFLQDHLSPGPNAGFFISPHHLNLLSPGPAWDHIFNNF